MIDHVFLIKEMLLVRVQRVLGQRVWEIWGGISHMLGGAWGVTFGIREAPPFSTVSITSVTFGISERSHSGTVA